MSAEGGPPASVDDLGEVCVAASLASFLSSVSFMMSLASCSESHSIVFSRGFELANQRLERILEARLQDLAEPDPVRLSQYQYRSLLHQRRRLGLLLVLIIALLSLFAVLRRCGGVSCHLHSRTAFRISYHGRKPGLDQQIRQQKCNKPV